MPLAAPSAVLLAHAQADALRERLRQRPDALLVACYCAQWCRTCESYRRDFEALAQRLPQHVFVWVDVEDSPQLLGGDEVENFPTLLVIEDGKTRFFGPMLPHVGHLRRVLETLADSATEPPVVTVLPTDLADRLAGSAKRPS